MLRSDLMRFNQLALAAYLHPLSSPSLLLLSLLSSTRRSHASSVCRPLAKYVFFSRIRGNNKALHQTGVKYSPKAALPSIDLVFFLATFKTLWDRLYFWIVEHLHIFRFFGLFVCCNTIKSSSYTLLVN